MTVGVSPSPAAPTGAPAPDTVAAILDRFDWQLAEIGRRQHRFTWLRDPDSAEWLVVDAYYPSHKVIVVAGDERLHALCLELAPAHGLRVLTVGPEELARDAAETAKAMRARLLGAGPPRPSALPPAPAPAVGLAGQDDDEDDYAAAAVPPVPPVAPLAPAKPTARPRHTTGEGAWLGIALGVVVLVEALLAIGTLGFGDGDWLLAFGLLIDAAARVAGVIAGGSAGDLNRAWTALIFGTPALLAVDAAESDEPARVAQTAAITAAFAIALGLLAAAI